MATKQVLVNKVFNKFTHEFIPQMFKPSWSPKKADLIESYGNIAIEEIPQYTAQVKQHQPLFLPYVTVSSNDPAVTFYEPFSSASNLFLVTEDFLSFLDQITAKIDDELTSDTFVQWAFNADGSVNTANSKVDTLLSQFHYKLVEIENDIKNDSWRKTSGNILEFFLRHIYSLNIEARETAFDAFGKRFDLVTQAEKAKKGLIPFIDYDPELLQIELQDDGLIAFNYAEPITLERRFDKESLALAGLDVDKVYLYFPTIQAGLVEGYVPNMNYTKTQFIGTYNSNNSVKNDVTLYNAPFWMCKFYSQSATIAKNNGKPVFKNVAPYVALSLGSVAENADTGNTLAPYDAVTDHTNKLDYMDNLIFNIGSPKRYQ